MAIPIIGTIIEGAATAIGGLLDGIIGDKTKRDEAKAQVSLILASQFGQMEETYRTELETQKAIIVAELEQGDTYTKRARPSVIYAGLAAVVLGASAVEVHIRTAPGFGPDAAASLTQEQITQNYDVGVGEKFFLLFDISETISAAPESSYILFEVAQYDTYAY